MKISVVLPVYNVEDFLEEAITSLVECKLDCRDIEFIFVDDGSTDDSLSIIKSWSKSDSRIKFFSKKNQGAGYSRNYGMSKASGEYILFMDPDDWINSEGFDYMLNMLNKYNSQVDVILFGFNVISGGKLIHSKCNSDLKMYRSPSEFFSEFHSIFTQNSFFVVWNKLYRKDFLLDNDLFFSKQKTGQDAIFNIAVFSQLSQILILNKVYYNYRKNRPNSAQNSVRYNKLNDNLNIYDHFCEMVEMKKINTNLHNTHLINSLFQGLRGKNKNTTSIKEFGKIKDYSSRIILDSSFRLFMKIVYIRYKLKMYF